MRDHPQLAAALRVIERLGPSTIQPLAAASRLPASLKRDIRDTMINMHNDPDAAQHIRQGYIDRFVAVQDSDYDDIRAMLAVCERADFMTLK
jgi:ABC-type phosphate/phosphonate transport system substrate-binding protein